MLTVKIHKAKSDLALEIMKYIFHFIEKPYNLRISSTIKRSCNRSVYFGTEIITSFVTKICELLPNAIENATSLELLKKDVKLWTTDKCLCSN